MTALLPATGRGSWDVDEAYRLHTEERISIRELARQLQISPAAVSQRFKRTYGDNYQARPRYRYLPWRLPEHHLSNVSTTAQRLVYLVRSETTGDLSAVERRKLDHWLRGWPKGMVIEFDPAALDGYGAFNFRPPIPGEEILYGRIAVKPLRFEPEE